MIARRCRRMDFSGAIVDGKKKQLSDPFFTIRSSRDRHLPVFFPKNFPRDDGARGPIARGINTESTNESFFYPVSGHILVSFSYGVSAVSPSQPTPE